MTLGIRQLAMFASKNKQVVQIRIQLSHVGAVLERWSLGVHMGVLFCLSLSDQLRRIMTNRQTVCPSNLPV